ncbi:unnamed protein product [Pseudo-nitzschia multistriata]|uniref:Uncharacterized protein n=1 Tax=Pseudo-nitzschia multistriata TaxID=183589 RepID=A0A448YV41_9STRA|nr:unnamed protein product [Pseudo-nitzschia multistriata]
MAQRDLNQHRRTQASLPKFSKSRDGEVEGKGGRVSYGNDDIGTWEWKGKGKGDKKSKKSSKKGKSGKKEKKEKKYGYYERSWGKGTPSQYQTKLPTLNPVLSPTFLPTLVPTPTKNLGSGSDSEDARPSTETSNDCPPERPPTIVPPSPSFVSTKNPTRAPSPTIATDKENTMSVNLPIYAIDYTFSQTSRTPIKVDFLELQTLTQSFFKNYMLTAYEVSAQVTLVDFSTSFVTAHFTPGEPIHIQYNSTAYFDSKSINIPTAQNLFVVLENSLVSTQAYVDDLQSQLEEVNPFSSTTEAIFTDPKDLPVTQSSAKTEVGAASASVAAALTLTVVASALFLRMRKSTDDNVYDERVKKEIKGDTTVAGETYVMENDHFSQGISLSDSLSMRSSEHDQLPNSTSLLGETIHQNIPKSRTIKETGNVHDVSNGHSPAVKNKPRTIEDIERLLSLGDCDII